MSVNIYTEGGLKRIAGNGGGGEVDAELSETSKNPVENRIITEELNNIKKSVGDGKRDVANAITEKGVTTATDASFATLVDNIDKIVTLIQGTQDADVTAGDILFGKYCYAEGAKLMGTMPIRGAVNQSLAPNGTYTIPQGYHNGSGKVVQNLETKAAQTYTPGTANQAIPAGRFLTGAQTILGDANLIPANIAKGKSIFGVAGEFEGGSVFVKELSFTNSVIDKSNISCSFAPDIVLILLLGKMATGVNLTNIFPPNSCSFTGYFFGGDTRGYGEYGSIRALSTSSCYSSLYVVPSVSRTTISFKKTWSESYDFNATYQFDSNIPSGIIRSAMTKIYLVALKIS